MLIVGCGQVGRDVARLALAAGESVTGVVRSADSAAALQALGAQALQLDLLADSLDGLDTAGESVFHFAPPPGEGIEDPLTARLIAHFEQAGHPRRLVYISTTGVYGDCDGAWVDETWPTNPKADRSRRRLDAEQRLQHWRETSGAELVILRVAGIYACDRLPLARIRSGQPMVRAEEAPWTNRIHAEDLADICLRAMEQAPNGALYNVCDGHPSTMTDYFTQVAETAGLSPPPQIPLADAEGQVSAGMLSYLRESRRLSNQRLLDELDIRLRYPDLRQGLSGCFSVT